jgi:hypothetical protein
MTHKHCARCGANKSFADYGKNQAKPDGLQVYCRDCRKKKSSSGLARKDGIISQAEKDCANPKANIPRIRKDPSEDLRADIEFLLHRFDILEMKVASLVSAQSERKPSPRYLPPAIPDDDAVEVEF